MQIFSNLYTALDETTKTNGKLRALEQFFREAPASDAAWALFFLSGRRLKRVVKSGNLREWALELSGLPRWLFEECYDNVGDMAETIALLIPGKETTDTRPFHAWIEEELLALRSEDEPEQRARLQRIWTSLGARDRFVWNKVITGAFRVGVSQRLVTRALANVSGIEAEVIAHRLMGPWEPSPAFYRDLLDADTTDTQRSRPYPFFLAHPLEEEPQTLGTPSEWHIEWKWDGIRAQLIQRGGETFIWTRGEELVTDRWPEIRDAARNLPGGTVIDGEILAYKEGMPMRFGDLQRRIGRKTIGKKLLAEAPAVLMCYDLLEHAGEDIRTWPAEARRAALAALIESAREDALRISPLVHAESWEALARLRSESRARRVEGFMLKKRDAPYGVGRVRGPWWKWKVEPYTIDAVLIYAQRGHGRRASLYTDYTFAVWDGDDLVPFAKAYSGLTDEEMRRVDNFVRKNTREKFGPVRSVTPALVFELGFEGIQESTRHKSGVAVRFPRMLRWREDKKPGDADRLETVKALAQ